MEYQKIINLLDDTTNQLFSEQEIVLKKLTMSQRKI